MRLSGFPLPLLSSALLSLPTTAHFLRFSNNVNNWTPAQETTRTNSNGLTDGFTPKPTPGPGESDRTDGERVTDLLLKRRRGKRDTSATGKETETSGWLNEHTCGWFSGSASFAWTCGSEQRCATNPSGVVACASGTYSPFFGICLDYSASQAGKCDDIGAATGCCQNSASPSCVTYLWTKTAGEKQQRSMFHCSQNVGVFTINDAPQKVLDASSSAASSRSRASEASAHSSSVATSTEADDPESTDSESSSDHDEPEEESEHTHNVNAVIAGVVAGVGSLLILSGLAIYMLRRGNGAGGGRKCSFTLKPKIKAKSEKKTVVVGENERESRDARREARRTREREREAFGEGEGDGPPQRDDRDMAPGLTARDAHAHIMPPPYVDPDSGTTHARSYDQYEQRGPEAGQNQSSNGSGSNRGERSRSRSKKAGRY